MTAALVRILRERIRHRSAGHSDCSDRLAMIPRHRAFPGLRLRHGNLVSERELAELLDSVGIEHASARDDQRPARPFERTHCEIELARNGTSCV